MKTLTQIGTYAFGPRSYHEVNCLLTGLSRHIEEIRGSPSFTFRLRRTDEYVSEPRLYSNRERPYYQQPVAQGMISSRHSPLVLPFCVKPEARRGKKNFVPNDSYDRIVIYKDPREGKRGYRTKLPKGSSKAYARFLLERLNDFAGGSEAPAV